MNIPLEVELATLKGKLVTVTDDALHALIHEGQLTYKQAIKALRDAKIDLDKRFYPWLRDVENLSNGEFEPPKDTPKDTPDLAKIPDSVTPGKQAASAKPASTVKSEGAK